MMIDAAPAVAIAATCEDRILPYAGWEEQPDQKWSFAARSPGGSSIFIFGAEHSRDPGQPQFPEIAAAFAQSRPSAVFFEGPDRGLASNGEEAIRTQGESGYVRYLASQAGLSAVTLEPSPVELLASLRDRFDADSIFLFFVLREAARLRDREGLAGAALDEAVTKLLTRAVPVASKAGLKTSIGDIATLAIASKAHWPDRDWRSLPMDWFSPGEGPSEARFLPAINTAVSEERDRHMVQLFTAAAKSGARIFVVVGRNHVPMIAPALECAFQR